VVVWPSVVAESAPTKPSPAPFQKRSLGGRVVDMPVELPSAGHIVSPRDTSFLVAA